MRIQGLLLGIVVSVAVVTGGAAARSGGTAAPASQPASQVQSVASVTPAGDDDPGPFNGLHV